MSLASIGYREFLVSAPRAVGDPLYSEADRAWSSVQCSSSGCSATVLGELFDFRLISLAVTVGFFLSGKASGSRHSLAGTSRPRVFAWVARVPANCGVSGSCALHRSTASMALRSGGVFCRAPRNTTHQCLKADGNPRLSYPSPREMLFFMTSLICKTSKIIIEL